MNPTNHWGSPVFYQFGREDTLSHCSVCHKRFGYLHDHLISPIDTPVLRAVCLFGF